MITQGYIQNPREFNGTVAIRWLRTESESGDRKLKFDWLNFINKDPKFWVLMGSKVIFRYDWTIKSKICVLDW